MGLPDPAGQGDEDDLLAPRSRPQPAGQFIAVHPGHTVVQHRDIGPRVDRRVHGPGPAIGDLHPVAEHAQDQREGIGRVAVVVHDQDAKAGCGPPASVASPGLADVSGRHRPRGGLDRAAGIMGLPPIRCELLPVLWSTSNGSTPQGLYIYQRTRAEVPLTSPFLSHAALNSRGVA
jgi:hypothetical protein